MIPWLQKGKTAVITGGANGIGLAAAERFLATGMNVVMADQNEDALSAVSDRLASDSLKNFVCDVSDFDQLKALRDFTESQFGATHCLMNNAGASVTRAKPWEDVDGWRKQLDINLWGIIYGCQAFVPSMLTVGEPVAIINTGSKQGITNPPGGYAYNLSKAGVLNYTQSLAHALREEARETGANAIDVHLLVPGFTYSNMIAQFVPEKPEGAWSTAEVIDYMLDGIAEGHFCILCPDNDTPRELDEKRIQWNTDDLLKNRPALSRWHPEFADDYSKFIE